MYLEIIWVSKACHVNSFAYKLACKVYTNVCSADTIKLERNSGK